ncbi:TPA: hypothetical protein N0F65_006414 [Lagenidium giganteum]|uniref:Phosphatidylinositol-3,4,5-trisphosphate 3-phosphatase n=1 Tax=Lagenidium giganteum TaxID=4803 RepID=A0AAV2Z406_9STRA|nr:TPA: hypothetical protein N0F65_006414 [Lagenidium giganteum]
MKALRAAVSGTRNRYNQGGYDLDLTYITPKLIAMGYPASGVEKTYRNDISEVASFLNAQHPNAYRVFNLSERKYDYSKFEGRVSECGFPDHHPPPLQVLLDIMNDMMAWTARSQNNVLVVHCMAGKGRTGVVCSCYLLLTGYYGDIFALKRERQLRERANHAIQDFWTARGQGVRYPSQAMYIYYFIKVLRRLGRTPVQIPRLLPAKRLLLKRVIFHGIPDYDAAPRGGCTPFLQVLPAPSQHVKTDLLYNSSWKKPVFETYVPDDRGTIVYEINCVIQGDTLIRCFHANTFSMLGKHVVQMFHFTFHTDFFHKECDLYRLSKDDIDGAKGNPRFPDSFQLDCHVAFCDPMPESFHTAPSYEVPGRVPLARHKSESVLPKTEQPLMGWLFKQGGFVKNWKRRWFVAREGRMTYYGGASEPTALGSVDLRGATVDSCSAQEIGARNSDLFYFKLVPSRPGQRIYYFGAESEVEMVRWMSGLGPQTCYGLRPSRNATPNSDQAPVPLVSYRSVRVRNDRDDFVKFSRPVPPSERQQSMPKQQQHQPEPTISSIRVNPPVSSYSPIYNSSVPYTDGTLSPPMSRHSDGSLEAVSGVRASYSNGNRESDLDYDLDRRFLCTTGQPQVVASQPVECHAIASDLKRATMLQELEEDCRSAIYIYSADELYMASRLQRHLRENDNQLSRLHAYVATDSMCEAEAMLVSAILDHFPELLDAMEHNPIMFVRMIAGEEIEVDTVRGKRPLSVLL